MTVFGIIGGDDVELIYMLANKTNSESFLEFMQQFLYLTLTPAEDIVVVLDNHSAHKSESTRAFLR